MQGRELVYTSRFLDAKDVANITAARWEHGYHFAFMETDSILKCARAETISGSL